ncbi:MAG: uroporphyrinogen-III C-methyltransferase [Gammaproteobacteria bacterium]
MMTLEETPENPTPEETKISPPHSFIQYAALIIAIIGVVLALAVGGATFWTGQRLLTNLTAQNQQFQTTQTQLQTQLQEQQNSLNTLNQHWQQLSQWQNQMSRWELSQAEYFVRLANFHLQTESNIPSAIQLLKMADDSLAASNDNSLINIRQLLMQNISTLQAVVLPNPAELIARLDMLNQQITQLTIPEQKSQPVSQTNTPATTTQNQNKAISFWKAGLENLLNDLRQLVTIHHTNTPQILTPTQRADTQQTIQLKLMQIQWAILNRQPEIYQQGLQQVSGWLQQYYPQNATTQTLLQNLNQLKSVILMPTNLPNINDTLTAIQTARQQLNNMVNTSQPSSSAPVPSAAVPKLPAPATPPQPTPPPGPESVAS